MERTGVWPAHTATHNQVEEKGKAASATNSVANGVTADSVDSYSNTHKTISTEFVMCLYIFLFILRLSCEYNRLRLVFFPSII